MSADVFLKRGGSTPQYLVLNNRIDGIDGISAYVTMKLDKADLAPYWWCERHHVSLGASSSQSHHACSDIRAVLDHRSHAFLDQTED